jgi:hypothetical protein
MRSRILLSILVLGLLPGFAQAGKKNTKRSKDSSERTTDARFSGATVHGKYAHSPETVVSVESEKKLIRIVKPREKFKFQIKKSLEDYK